MWEIGKDQKPGGGSWVSSSNPVKSVELLIIPDWENNKMAEIRKDNNPAKNVKICEYCVGFFLNVVFNVSVCNY